MLVILGDTFHFTHIYKSGKLCYICTEGALIFSDMKKEKQIKSYTRRTKSGKTVTVRAHSAKYDAADDLVKSLLKKKGSGKEFELAVDTKGVDKLVNEMADSGRLIVPVSKEEFRAWYHEPDSIAGKAAGKKLRSVLGSKEYKKLDETASSGYSTKGHSKLYGTLDGIINSEANVSKRLDARGKSGKSAKRGTNKDILYSRGENTGDSFITAAQQLARSDSKGRSNKKALQTLVRAGFIKDSGDGEFQFADVHEVPRRNRKFFDKVFSAYEDESDKY